MQNLKHSRYPLSVCLLHWLVAIALIGNLAIGWLLDDQMDLMSLHKSVGIAILALAAIRLVNKLLQRKSLPASVNPAGSRQYLAEKAVHGLLYASMFVIPVLGWLKTNAAGHTLKFLDSYALPTLLEKNRQLSHLLGDLHSAAALGLALLIALHVTGALAHWLLKSENVLTRILPLRLSGK